MQPVWPRSVTGAEPDIGELEEADMCVHFKEGDSHGNGSLRGDV